MTPFLSVCREPNVSVSSNSFVAVLGGASFER